MLGRLFSSGSGERKLKSTIRLDSDDSRGSVTLPLTFSCVRLAGFWVRRKRRSFDFISGGQKVGIEEWERIKKKKYEKRDKRKKEKLFLRRAERKRKEAKGQRGVEQ